MVEGCIAGVVAHTEEGAHPQRPQLVEGANGECRRVVSSSRAMASKRFVGQNVIGRPPQTRDAVASTTGWWRCKRFDFPVLSALRKLIITCARVMPPPEFPMRSSKSSTILTGFSFDKGIKGFRKGLRRWRPSAAVRSEPNIHYPGN